MNDKLIQKRLKKLTFCVIFVSLIILLIGSLVSAALAKILEESTNSQMQSEAEQYKNYIFRQFDTDFQTLHTLESFFKFNNSMDTDAFAQKLYESNNQNHFIRMAYYSTSGIGIRATLNHSVETDLSVDTLPDMLRILSEKRGQARIQFPRSFTMKIWENLFSPTVSLYIPTKLSPALLLPVTASKYSPISWTIKVR